MGHPTKHIHTAITTTPAPKQHTQVKEYLASRKGQRLSVSEIRHGMQAQSDVDVKQVRSRLGLGFGVVWCRPCGGAKRHGRGLRDPGGGLHSSTMGGRGRFLLTIPYP